MRLALRFIAGKYQGGEFPIEEGREIVVGRSNDLDMVLVEEMVSRKHAIFKMTDGVINIQDLGSTNGTFVNGERISSAEIREGDRVLIGSNIVRVVSLEDSAKGPTGFGAGDIAPINQTMDGRRVTEVGVAIPAPPSRLGRRNESTSESRMRGNLDEIPLPDLLQLFGSSKKTGALYIETLEAFGKIYLKDGDIVHAEIESSDGSLLPLPNMKALHRILTWKGGLFELGQGESPVGIEPINEGVNGLLMEAFRQKDELSQLNARLPDMTAKLGLNLKLTKAFKDLSPTALDMLQAVLTTTSVQEAIDACVLLDLESCQELVALLEAGYIEIN